MTDTIDFDVDLTNEWTPEDSLALDAEILAAYGRREVPLGRYSKWQSRALHVATLTCASRGMNASLIAAHLKMSHRHVERILSGEQKVVTWAPPPSMAEVLQAPSEDRIQPCTAVGCENITRPRHALAEHWPGTKARHRRGLCSKCNSALARARRSAS